MNFNDVVAKISDASGLSKSDSEKALRAFENVVNDAMASGEKVSLSNFIQFNVVDIPEREHTDLHTKKKFTTPAHKTVKVKAMKGLKESVHE